LTPVIELRSLGVRLGGRPVLSDLEATLTGRAIGLLGPNGAGKTTLIHTLLGFHAPSSGAARVLGVDVAKGSTAVRSLLGYMPENEAYLADETAVRFVRLMAELSGLPRQAALERAHETLFYVGLGEARYRKLGTFSLGMRQRAKLAQAIAHGPRLLLLDEPTNGLDPAARQRMLRLIGEIRDRGTNVLVSSHLLRDVEEVCDEVLILRDGRVAAHVDLTAQRREDRRFLDLELVGDGRAFAEGAAALGCEAAVGSGGRVKLVVPETVDAQILYALAHDQGAQIRRLSFRRDALEDIFLRAMEAGDGGL
jgi:ABC-2 type transport system ATP-binding protein